MTNGSTIEVWSDTTTGPPGATSFTYANTPSWHSMTTHSSFASIFMALHEDWDDVQKLRLKGAAGDSVVDDQRQCRNLHQEHRHHGTTVLIKSKRRDN